MEFDLYKTKKDNTINNLKAKLLDQIEDGLFILIISANQDYDIPFINDASYKIFEILPDKIFTNTVLSVYDRIHPDDKPIVKQSLIESLKKKKNWNIIFKANLPSKGLSWFRLSSVRRVNNDGSVVINGRIIDISEVERQKQRIKSLEEKVEFAIETSNIGIWDWDLVANTMHYSLQSLKVLEHEATLFLKHAKRWDEIIHPDDIDKYNSVLQDHLDNNTSFYEHLHRVLTSNDKYSWIITRGRVVERDINGKPLKIIGTHTNVSSQKEKELELEKNIELYSSKNSRLLNFSHIVTHNLNSHSGNFKMLLDIIDLEESLKEKREAMNYLRTISDDLNRTIEDLSDIVNFESEIDILIEPLNLNNYLSRVLNVVSAYSYRDNPTIINNIPAEATINFNPAYLESILQNLCTNAIKYADPYRQLIIEFNFFIEHGNKVLIVKDNGLGIDLEKDGHLLFGMYKTFHKNVNANAKGIGLYITKNQIEAMKGKLTVESQVGHGTVFKIVFKD